MSGPFHIPTDVKSAVQIFTNPHPANSPLGVWMRPYGCTMAHIICIGGGGGGGGGFGSTAGSSRGGGGGGASSAMTRLTVPLITLPDRLYVCSGEGGAGVTAGTAGTGKISWISITPGDPSAVPTNVVLTSSATVAGGGVTATTSTGGSAGAAGAIAAIAACPLAGEGHFLSIAGQNGTTGGTGNSNGTALTLPVNGVLMSGGTGGAGCVAGDNTGGILNGTGALIEDLKPAAGTAGGSGVNAHQLWRPFFSYGGQGGGSSNSVNGLPGGYGAYGAGGGGGGAGVTNGGRGGDGGNGIVIFICW